MSMTYEYVLNGKEFKNFRVSFKSVGKCTWTVNILFNVISRISSSSRANPPEKIFNLKSDKDRKTTKNKLILLKTRIFRCSSFYIILLSILETTMPSSIVQRRLFDNNAFIKNAKTPPSKWFGHKTVTNTEPRLHFPTFFCESLTSFLFYTKFARHYFYYLLSY